MLSAPCRGHHSEGIILQHILKAVCCAAHRRLQAPRHALRLGPEKKDPACIQQGTCGERGMEDLDCVVGGAAAGQRGRRDDARVAQRPEVHPKFLVVVHAQQFLVHLVGPQ